MISNHVRKSSRVHAIEEQDSNVRLKAFTENFSEVFYNIQYGFCLRNYIETLSTIYLIQLANPISWLDPVNDF